MKQLVLMGLVLGGMLLIGTNLWAKPKGDPETIRHLTTGSVVGSITKSGHHLWQGIPYAEPPVGPLRWKSPKPVASWDGVLKATKPSPYCIQYTGATIGRLKAIAGEVSGHEDCLYLNVWSRPDRRSEGLRPVMFWIHGGGHSVGESKNYKGDKLLEDHDVVLVTVNYRLGPLGWFRHEALAEKADDKRERSGNFAVLDLIQALEWVRDHIAKFGGDPQNVTIFGESAGGSNVMALMASPLASGLFHRGISQSGFVRWVTPDVAEKSKDQGGHEASSFEVINRLLIADGNAINREEATRRQKTMSGVEIEAYLRGLSAETLLKAYQAQFAGMISMPSQFRDGVVLPDLPAEQAFRQGQFNQVPIILGTNRDETKLFMMADPEYVEFKWGVLPTVKDSTYYHLSAHYGDAYWKVSQVDQMADAMVASGHADVFVYRFDWDEEPQLFGLDLGKLLGASHAFEIPFVFNDPDSFIAPIASYFVYNKDNKPGREFLAHTMSSYWVRFAHEGNPMAGVSDELGVIWEPWNLEGHENLIIFDDPRDQKLGMISHRLTLQGLKDQLKQEQGFSSDQQKCRVYLKNFGADEFYQGQCSDL